MRSLIILPLFSQWHAHTVTLCFTHCLHRIRPLVAAVALLCGTMFTEKNFISLLFGLHEDSSTSVEFLFDEHFGNIIILIGFCHFWSVHICPVQKCNCFGGSKVTFKAFKGMGMIPLERWSSKLSIVRTWMKFVSSHPYLEGYMWFNNILFITIQFKFRMNKSYVVCKICKSIIVILRFLIHHSFWLYCSCVEKCVQCYILWYHFRHFYIKESSCCEVLLF